MLDHDDNGLRVKNILLNLCSIIAFIDSSSDVSRAWFVSFANRKLGDDINEKRCRSRRHAREFRFSR